MCLDFHIKSCDIKEVCECCIEAKMTKKSIPKKSESKTYEVLDLIHTDICGPMQTITPGHKKYFLTMIDDYSRYTKVYLLNQKSEACQKIKEYVKFVQTKFRKTPKKIRSDRGGEYLSEQLQSFLRNEGIQVELTNPYTPEQNGCAERKNRYLVEMIRSMLNDSGLPNKYWGEALMTANHLQNRLPTAHKENTPYESWHKRKPTMNYIRKFGSKAYIIVPAEKRQKLDNKARKLIFVGYEEGTKGYRLLDTETDRIHISKDVTFIEGDPHKSKMKDINETEVTMNSDDSDIEVSLETAQDQKVDDNSDHEQEHIVDGLRRSQRTNKGRAPERLIETINKVIADEIEPKNYDEAINSEKSDQWFKAMYEVDATLARVNPSKLNWN
jgi:hypothetical protein